MFNQIRRKPKGVRQQYAFWYAAGITGMIALVWGVSLQYRFDESMFASADEEAYSGAFSQFLSDAKENFANVFSAVSTSTPEHVSETATTTEASPTTTPFILTPRASTTIQNGPKEEGRSVRVETVSEAGTSTKENEQY